MEAFRDDLDPVSCRQVDAACRSSFEDHVIWESDQSIVTEGTVDVPDSQCSHGHEQYMSNSDANGSHLRHPESASGEALASEEYKAAQELVYLLSGFSAAVQDLDEYLDQFDCTLPSMSISVVGQHFRFQPDYGVVPNLGSVEIGFRELPLLLEPHGFEQVGQLDAHRCDVNLTLVNDVTDCRSLVSFCENINMDAVVPMTIQALEIILSRKLGLHLHISGEDHLERLMPGLRLADMCKNRPVLAAIGTTLLEFCSFLHASYQAIALDIVSRWTDALRPAPKSAMDFF